MTLSKKYHFLLFTIIIVTPLVVYLNSLVNTFVYDDYLTVTNNHFIREWRYLSALFSKKYSAISNELTYRPVVTLSYFIDYALWQLKPAGYHFVNSVIHTVNVILLYFLTYRLFSNRISSLISCLMFSLHPVFSETVNAISYREDLLSATFLLIAFIFFLKSSNTATKIRNISLFYAVSLIAYFFALLSKEMAITFPLLAFVYDFIFRREDNSHGQNTGKSFSGIHFIKNRLVTHYIGYIVISGIYLFLRFKIFKNPGESMSYPEKSIFVNFLMMTKVVGYYFKLFFIPVPLNADYVVPVTHSFSDGAFLVSFLSIVSAIVLAKKCCFSRAWIFALSWFLITLFPVLNIIPILNIMAERYLYIPGIGFTMFMSLVFTKGFQRYHRIKYYFLSFVAIICLLMMWGTIQRNRIWLNEFTFSTETIRRSPKSFRIYNDLGYFYYTNGSIDEAIQAFESSIRVMPTHPKAHCNLGAAYSLKGMQDKAIEELKTAVRLREQYPEAHNNLGLLYKKKGLFDLAASEYGAALKANPYYADAHNNLGSVYIDTGRYEEAFSELEKALKIRSDFALAHYNMAVVYFKKGQVENAYRKLLEARQLDPDNADVHLSLGVVYKDYFHDAAKAVFHLKESLRINPQHKQSEEMRKVIEELTLPR
ncbi:MAG: tetratricopeptide repeat protein [Planctomycetes bacterium]|nr:tetratricopeptide repeat protein [Planctomycetota bacterium]